MHAVYLKGFLKIHELNGGAKLHEFPTTLYIALLEMIFKYMSLVYL